MKAIWNSVGPIVILQLAIAFIYIAWPHISRAMIAVGNLMAPLFPDPPQAASETRKPFRGKWREAAYQGEHRQNHRRAEAPKEPPVRPAPSQREVYLQVLKLSPDATTAQIRRAYRKQAKTYHPDRFASARHSEAERTRAMQKMRDINEAYDWLSSQA
ncbi:MAG: J domain-containing protein [Henriciella sp.]